MRGLCIGSKASISDRCTPAPAAAAAPGGWRGRGGAGRGVPPASSGCAALLLCLAPVWHLLSQTVGAGRVRQTRMLGIATRCSSASTAGPYDGASSRSGSNRAGSSLAAAAGAATAVTAPSTGGRLDSPIASGSSTSSSSSGAVASSSCVVRPAESADYWAVADLHCSAFYPRAPPFWFSALRVDRVMAVQLGELH